MYEIHESVGNFSRLSFTGEEWECSDYLEKRFEEFIRFKKKMSYTEYEKEKQLFFSYFYMKAI